MPSGTSDSQVALLHVLAASHEDQLELAPIVATLADEHRRSAKWRFRKLGKKLRDGMPVVEALEQTPDILRDREITTIRLAMQSGILGEAYSELLTARESEQENRVGWKHNLVYAVVLVVAVILVASFLAAFIMPSMREILSELGLSQSRFSTRFTQVMSLDVFPLLAFLLPLVVVAGLVFAVRVPVQAFVRRRMIRPLTPGRKQEANTDLLSMFSLVLRNGRPIQAAISTLAKYHHDARIRKKLLYVRNEIEHGAAAWDALEEVGLTNSQTAGALSSCESAADQGWLLGQAVLWERSRARHFRNVIAAVAGPLAIVACGVIVFWSILAVFSVLLTLILSLS
jgi:type II secretory pathway component PulF